MSKHYRTGGRSCKQESQRRRHLKKILLHESYNYCGYCGKKIAEKKLTIDHIVPVSKGGQTTLTNLVLCCEPCNRTKRDMTPAEWLDFLDKKNSKAGDVKEIFLI